MKYVHTNKDPKEIDYVIPDNDGDVYTNNSVTSEEEILPYDEVEEDTVDTVTGLIKFGASGAGVLIGGIMLGVGLSGSVNGTEKLVTVAAGGAFSTFSLVKCIKSTMTMIGIKPEENKKLTKTIAKE